jgi:outer membrane protein
VKPFNVTSIIFSLLLGSVFVVTAHAKENQQKLEENWGLAITGMLIWTPEYTGSDEYEVIGEVSIDGYFSLSEQSTLFVNRSGFGLNYQLSGHLNTGILGNVRTDQDRSNIKHLDGLSNIDVAFEVGSYLSYQLTDRLEISISGLFDVSDTHDGWVTNLNLSHETMIPNTAITITTLAEIGYANKKYNNTYYGVKASTNSIPDQSSFVLGSGFNSTTLGTVFSYASSETTALIGSISATQIIGDAKDSPIIKEDTFVTVGLGVVYTF